MPDFRVQHPYIEDAHNRILKISIARHKTIQYAFET